MRQKIIHADRDTIAPMSDDDEAQARNELADLANSDEYETVAGLRKAGLFPMSHDYAKFATDPI